MGLLGEYLLVDEQTLDYMVELDNDSLIAAIEELSGEPDAIKYGIDKLWDGLHFLLTGKSASYPIEDDKLSEAVVGVHVFNDDDEEADFIGCTENDELPDIINALKSVDIDKLRENFDPADFQKNKVYPNIWLAENADSLFAELIRELNNLTAFYEAAYASGYHVVISIY